MHRHLRQRNECVPIPDTGRNKPTSCWTSFQYKAQGVFESTAGTRCINIGTENRLFHKILIQSILTLCRTPECLLFVINLKMRGNTDQ